jgi:RNA methyltransferase, TrmH family
MQKDTSRAPIRIVQSRQNSRIKELRSALRHGGKTEDGRIAIEGFHLLEEALRSNLDVTTLFFTEGQEALLSSLPLSSTTELLAVPSDLLCSALATETPQPIAALIDAPHFRWDNLYQSTALIVVAVGLQDPGNLGTLVRSAEAFGATGMITLEGTVNPWNPKALRASSGSTFRLPILASTEHECFSQLRKEGIRIAASTVLDGISLEEMDWSQPTALLIGNEGSGLTSQQVNAADLRVTIPCPGLVESLNAAVAASILLYTASSDRMRKHAGGMSYA